MKILHMLALGGAGGIESLCVDIAKYSTDANYFYFMWGGGNNTEKIKLLTDNVVIRNFSIKCFLKEYIFFKNYCIENSIECIVVQGISPAMLIFSVMLKKAVPSIKVISYLHANGESLFKVKKQKIVFKYAYKQVDGCIAISNSVNESVKEFCGDNQKIHTIYNGVDTSKFEYVKNKERNDIPSLIYVGRLISVKGVDLLIQSMRMVTQDCEVYIIGDGPQKKELEHLTEKLGLQSKIHFEGIQWNINEWLQKADLFVHPAVCKEGFGITLIEAMATGVPCVAFNKGAIPEIIQNNINGFIVEKDNSKDLALKIDEVLMLMLEQPDRWTELRYEARKRAEFFGIQKYVKELSSYIETL